MKPKMFPFNEPGHEIEPGKSGYPTSDGRPIAESEVHRDWMFHLLEQLKLRYRGQKVHVSADLLVYYEEGNPKQFVVPDVFVTLDCDPHNREHFLAWEENRRPNMVIELTSNMTREEDAITKPRHFAALGVPEYFLYDPFADYLSPPLKGFRFDGEKYQPIKPELDGSLLCQELGIRLCLEEGDLRLFDSEAGHALLTQIEYMEYKVQLQEQITKLLTKTHDAFRKALRLATKADKAVQELEKHNNRRTRKTAEKLLAESKRASEAAHQAKKESDQVVNLYKAEKTRLQILLDEHPQNG